MMQFPATNFHDLNLDWLLEQVKTMIAEWTEVQSEFSTIETQFDTISGEWETEKTWFHNYASTQLPIEVQTLFNAFIDTPVFEAMVKNSIDPDTIAEQTGDWLSDHVSPETGYVLDTSLQVANAAADSKAAGDAIGKVATDVDRIEDVLSNTADSLLESTYSVYITGSNVWGVSTSASPRACGIEQIPIGYTRVDVTANADNYTQIAFLTSNSHTSQQTPNYATGYDNVVLIAAGTTKTFDIPADAQYIYYTRYFSTTNRLPQLIRYSYLYDIKSKVDVTIPLGLHEIPADVNKLNIIRRCRQMTDIKWTPGKDIPRYMLVQRNPPYADTAASQIYKGTFKAGVEYTGIPYGQTNTTMTQYGYSYATVGSNIDFKTFVTSVSNPDSMLCVRDVSAASGNAHRSVAYATVCSGMVCYALNVAEVATNYVDNISGMSLIGKLNNNSVLLSDRLIKIGDVLNLEGSHTAIITDIIRDASGALTWVEISDASSAGLADSNYSDGQIGGLCRRKGWSRASLYAAGSWGDYSVYRYSGTVPYTPSPYVNVGDEFDCQRIVHYPCMPYEGEGFIYKTGYIPDDKIKILISHRGYGYLQVFKDGQEITGSPFAIGEDDQSIEISEIGAGSYRANMVNIDSTNETITNQTYWTTWTITE